MRALIILLTVAIVGAACLDQPPRPGPGPGVDAFVPPFDGSGSGSGFDAALHGEEANASATDGVPAGARDALDHPKPDALVDPHRGAVGLGDDHELLNHR